MERIANRLITAAIGLGAVGTIFGTSLYTGTLLYYIHFNYCNAVILLTIENPYKY